jgi:hypothetical protein
VDFGRRKKGFDPRLAGGMIPVWKPLWTKAARFSGSVAVTRLCARQSLLCAPVVTDGSAIAASSAAWSPVRATSQCQQTGISKENREIERILNARGAIAPGKPKLA